ncbi:aquaporin-5-like [Tubulanus polymorphus]|uniref:aquaporin-5-like n=1 Tax=Tubulanus polymorphus TaxID=672921 RepID=UPI003DA53F52
MSASLENIRLSSSLEDLKSLQFYQALLAEFFGTMLFLVVGVTSTLTWPGAPAPVTPGIAAAFGLGLGTVVWITAGKSGGHINPAVTLGMLVARKISAIRFFLYLVAQCCGAIVGALLVKGVTPTSVGGSFGATVVSKDLQSWQGLIVELVLTVVLVTTVFASTDNARKDLSGSGPLAIGISLFVCVIGGASYTGPSLNPARTLGSAVAGNVWKTHWVYWIGPMLAGAASALFWEFTIAANACPLRIKSWIVDVDYDPDRPADQYGEYIVPALSDQN